jgi:F0F1-type ATP synthase assembly protein I
MGLGTGGESIPSRSGGDEHEVYSEVWTSGVQGTTQSMGLIGRLIANTIVGLILLFLTNLFLSDEVPLNLLTIVICAIGGVVGWLVIVILHVLGIAF